MKASYIPICRDKWVRQEQDMSLEHTLDLQYARTDKADVKARLNIERTRVVRPLYMQVGNTFVKMVCELEQKIDNLAPDAEAVHIQTVLSMSNRLAKKKIKWLKDNKKQTLPG
jgi:chaperonin cofactor prefoldin